ncbi:MAG TPA: DUF4412 domain-containing protein [Prosthecobacter sp.]|nr:DUF4412 domain-containing protein [Prosthecobacter sp.]
MKTFFASLALAVLTLQPAFADWVIVQKSTTDGQVQDMTFKIKGDKARFDAGAQMSVILDSSAGGATILMHAQKAVVKMTAEMMKSAMAMAGNALGGVAKGPPAKPQATGQTEKVGAYETEIYTWSGPIGTGKFWVAKDFPQAKELNEIQDKMMKAMGNPVATLAPAAADFPGMVIKSEMTMMGKTVLSETVSAKEEPVDEAIFTLPADYNEMKLPGLPGGQ